MKLDFHNYIYNNLSKIFIRTFLIDAKKYFENYLKKSSEYIYNYLKTIFSNKRYNKNKLKYIWLSEFISYHSYLYNKPIIGEIIYDSTKNTYFINRKQDIFMLIFFPPYALIRTIDEKYLNYKMIIDYAARLRNLINRDLQLF